MADTLYKDGTVVILRSGGPLMTVDNSDVHSMPPDLMYCKWFDSAELGQEFFSQDALIEVSPEMVEVLQEKGVVDPIDLLRPLNFPVDQEPA